MSGETEMTQETTLTSAAKTARLRAPSERFTGRRAKKPKQLAVITDSCSGCAGGPVCQIYCPVEECMILRITTDAFPFSRIWVDPLKCVGCRKCLRQGPNETFLDGCPWDAIVMVPTREWEDEHGQLPY